MTSSAQPQVTSRILIVEDEADIRRLIRLALKSPHRDIHEADCVEAALSQIKQAPPDVLLLDLGLPDGMDGLNLLEMLVKDPDLRKMQVAVVTGSSQDEVIDRAKRLGVDFYLIKPFVPSVILHMVEHLEYRNSGMQVVKT